MKEGPLLVTGAIIPREGKVLITQRHHRSRFEPSRWEFPGGKVDFGEHPREALKRELKEELGIGIDTGPLYEISSHVYDKKGDIRHVVLLFYICRILEGEPRLIDCQDLMWADRVSIGQMEFVEGDRPLVEELIEDTGIWNIRT